MTCYYPNRQIAEGLQPCNSTTGSVSSCCRVGDVCLTNGFCFSAGQNSLVRRGCTDQSFNSTECPQICLTGDEGSVDVVMTPCGGYTHFCCGQDDAARSCCTDGNGTVLLAAGTAILPTATITLNTTIPATNTQSYASPSTTTTSTTVSTNCDPAGGASTAIKGGLGAATGFAALVAVIFAGLWIWQTSKLKKTETELRDAKRRLTALEPPKPLSR